MALLVAMCVTIAGAASVATTAVVLHVHKPAHHCVRQDATKKFLQHRDVHWSHPEQF
jgi:hypothetical protein